jgi:hypothetical protein
MKIFIEIAGYSRNWIILELEPSDIIESAKL